MADPIFADGLNISERQFSNGHITKVGIKVDSFIEWLTQHVDDKGWCNIEIKTSKGGKMYAQLDTWKPQKQEAGVPDSDIPF